MPSRSPIPLVFVGLALALVTAACGAGPSARSDEEKRARIQELYVQYQQSFPQVPSLSVEEALELAGEGRRVLFVDARTAAERQVSTLPGAVDSEEVEAHPEAFRDATLITYCTIGYRSGVLAERLRAAGLDARNLEGSILSWTHAGQPLESAGGPTRRLHVYGQTWDLAAEGYETVW